MKKYYSIIALAAVVLGAVSCEKEMAKENFAGSDTISFTAQFAGDKASFNAGKVSWAAGDVIAIFDGTSREDVTLAASDIDENGKATFVTTTLSTSAEKYYAFFPAALADGMDNGSIKVKTNTAQSAATTYPAASSCTAASKAFTFVNSGTLLYFENNNSAVETLTFVANNGETLSSAGAVNPATGAFTATGDAPASYVVYTLGASETSGCISVAAGTLTGGFTAIAKDDKGAYLGSYKVKAEKTFQNGYYYTLGNVLTKANVPAGAIPFEFTIADGKQAYFAQGNLKYTVNTEKWSLTDRTYNCFESYNTNVLCHFTWGYGDWSKVSGTSLYCTEYTTSQGMNWEAKYDYGQVIGEGWKTPSAGSKGNWATVLSLRTPTTIGGVKYLYAKAFITGLRYRGLIIFPDNFHMPAGITLTGVNDGTLKYDDNTLTSDQWDALENAGCVFLPAAGFAQPGAEALGQVLVRESPTANTEKVSGFYQSTTGSKDSSGKKMYRMDFNYNYNKGGVGSGALNVSTNAGTRDQRFSVRLIYPIN